MKVPIKAKVWVIGDLESGKTSVIRRYAYEEYKPNLLKLSGSTYYDKPVVFDDKKLVVQVWDGSGYYKVHKLYEYFFKDTLAIIIVFDLTNRDSFEGLLEWINDTEKFGGPNADVYLVGTKWDKVEKREVHSDEAQRLADEYNLMYFEVSAKDNIHIKELFFNVSSKVFYTIFD